MFRCRHITRLATLAAMRFLTITPVPMPALSPTMEKGKITEWCKKPGEMVNNGDTFCKVETDKAVVSYDNSGDEGILARVLVNEGEEITVGQPICLLVDEKEGLNSAEVKDWKDESAAGEEVAAAPAAAAEPAASAAEPAATAAPPAPKTSSERVKASPYAKTLAKEKNISLEAIEGTGGGVNRITAKDIEAAIARGVGTKSAATPTATAPSATVPAAKSSPKPAAAGAKKAPIPVNPNFEDIPVTTMRSVIAKRLHQSKNVDIPHYYIYGECRVDNVLALLKQLNAKGNGEYKITINDYIIKAVARANLLVPEANSAWYGDFIRQYSTVDVSVAVATPAGLITPIIRNAQAKGLVEISKEMKILAKKARENALMPDEFQGGTCSVSNLGASNVPSFTAIINPPQSLIVAVGTSTPKPQIRKNEETGEYEMTGKVDMCVNFTLSFDHRVVDGAVGAKWYQGFRDAIENPLSLLL